MDIPGGRLLRYSNSGEYLGAVAKPGLGPLEFTHPTRLLGTSDGYVLCNHSAHLIWFDREFRPTRSLDFRGGLPGIPHLEMSDAALVADGREMLALATTKRNGAWWQGFVRLNLQPLEILEFIREVPVDSPADLMYRLNLPVIAVAGGAAYALSYSQVPALVRLSAPQATLAAFPSEFVTLPALPDASSGASAAPALYASLEAASYPVALYGRGDYLYLLTRRPRSDHGTKWQITQIDPRSDVVVRTITLPTAANHLDVAPGPDWWALVEKGPVTHTGAQRFGPMVLVRSPLVENPATLENSAEPVLCR